MSLWFKHLEIGWSILGKQHVPKKSGKNDQPMILEDSFLPAEAEILADDDCLEPTMFGLATCKWCTDRTNLPCRYQFNFHDCRRKRKTHKLIMQHWAFAKLECFEDGILQASVFGIYLKIFSGSPGQVSFFLKIPKCFCWLLEKSHHLRSQKSFQKLPPRDKEPYYWHHEFPCWNQWGGQALTALANGPNSHASNLDNAEASVK